MQQCNQPPLASLPTRRVGRLPNKHALYFLSIDSVYVQHRRPVSRHRRRVCGNRLRHTFVNCYYRLYAIIINRVFRDLQMQPVRSRVAFCQHRHRYAN
jgi:hypothetical protein